MMRAIATIPAGKTSFGNEATGYAREHPGNLEILNLFIIPDQRFQRLLF